jgi:WD40 repeat protein
VIGSSDGTIRVYDNYERELKVLMDKNVKGSACLSVDIKRMKGNNIFVATGHAKGQVSLYELKGLHQNQEYGSISGKHHKTIADVHQTSVIAVKFFGEIGDQVPLLSAASCDLDGVVYLLYF